MDKYCGLCGGYHADTTGGCFIAKQQASEVKIGVMQQAYMDECARLRAERDRLRKEIAEGVRLVGKLHESDDELDVDLMELNWWADRNRPEVPRAE